MNKFQVIAVLVALLALSAESFRVVREAGDEAEAEPEAEPMAEAEAEPIELVAEPVAEVVAEAVEEADVPAGPVTQITDGIKQYYAQSVDTANSYIESIQGLKLEEKAKNLYDDTVKAANTYYGIIYDQLYHVVYPQQ